MRWLPKPQLPRLDFEYQPRSDRIRPAGWILWIAAIAFAGDVAWSYAKARESLQARAQEIALAPLPVPSPSKHKIYQPRNVQVEEDFARGTIYKIALPWGKLFSELRSSAVDGVSLISVQPEPDGGALRINAQAENIPAMLAYLARLESNRFFPSVALVRHEIRRDQTRQPVFFDVLATWNTRR